MKSERQKKNKETTKNYARLNDAFCPEFHAPRGLVELMPVSWIKIHSLQRRNRSKFTPALKHITSMDFDLSIENFSPFSSTKTCIPLKLANSLDAFVFSRPLVFLCLLFFCSQNLLELLSLQQWTEFFWFVVRMSTVNCWCTKHIFATLRDIFLFFFVLLIQVQPSEEKLITSVMLYLN